MLYVDRAAVEVPRALRAPSLREAKELLREHYMLPLLTRHTRRAPVKSHLWTDPSVRSSLVALFNGKCAFCEQFPLSEAGHPLDITHIRPLRNATGNDESPSIDHYGWLAYDWGNLVTACAGCNRARGNIFPTERPRADPLETSKACDRIEKPLLLNPCVDDPGKHLGFEPNGKCIALSSRGWTTVEVNQLNRNELVSARAARFDSLLGVIEDLQDAGHPQNSAALIASIAAALHPTAEFAGASKILLERPIRLLEKEYSKELGRGSADRADIPRFLKDASVSTIEKLLEAILTSITPYRRDAEGSTHAPRTEILRGVLFEARIEKIEIVNFKSIEHLVLNIGRGRSPETVTPIAALLGENAVGKSSVLQAIALTLMPMEDLAKIPRKQLAAMSRRLSVSTNDSSNHPAQVTVTFASGAVRSLRVTSSGILERNGSAEVIVLAYGAHRMFGEETRQASAYPPAQATQSMFHRNRVLRHPSGWMHRLDKTTFFAIARALHDILALSADDRIEQDDAGNVVILRQGERAALEELSDGYRSLLAMTLDIMRIMTATFGNLESATGIVLIDEMELHLHPSWKMKVVSAIRRAMPIVQFVFTTHDPLCLRGLYDGEAHVMMRATNGKVHLLEHLPDVRLMRAEQLLTSEYFGLSSTSDPDLLDDLNAVAETRSSHLPDALESILLGDEPEEQIFNEALRRHIRETLAQHAKELDRSKVREDAIEDVLSILRKHHGSAHA